MEDKYTPLQEGSKAYFRPWEGIILRDTIISIHRTTFYDTKEKRNKVATLYEFKHIKGSYRAYKTKEEIEKALGYI